MTARRQNETDRFKGPAKYAEYLVARVLVSTLQRLPIRSAYRLGRGVGWLAWKTLKRRRATVRKNLEVVNAWMGARSAERRTSNPAERETSNKEKPQVCSAISVRTPSSSSFQPSDSTQTSSPDDLNRQVKEVFLHTGANLFSGFTFNRMSLEQADQHVRIEGLEHLKTALAEGKGAIILLAHMGPWEALNQLPELARKHGIDAPFGAIYRKFNNVYLDKWFRHQREAAGTRLFGSRYKFYAPVDFLRAGGMLGVLSDQRASGGERVDYFGLKTKVTPLPGLLHLRSKAPLFGLSIATLGSAQWQIRLHRLPNPEIGPDQNAREVVAQTIARAMETALAEEPLDGFWFTDRFKDAKLRAQQAGRSVNCAKN
jgi:lauroyl/myristoyl acyltransferase